MFDTITNNITFGISIMMTSPHISVPEKDLLQKISEGDSHAFATLHGMYWNKLNRFLIVHVKSPEVAEDLGCDIFLKLWNDRQMLKNINSFDAFLFIAAKNKALNYLKKAARDTNMQKAYFKELQACAITHPSDYRMLDAESAAILRTAIKQLSPQRQQVFLLHREEGLSYEEIAARLNISKFTVRNSMSNALQIIKDFVRRHHADTLAALWLMINL